MIPVLPSLAYAFRYPMTPLGGVFFMVMGVFVMMGAAWRTRRLQLVSAGFAAAGVGMAACWRLSLDLPAPSILQVAALAIAIGLEIAAFRLVLPRLTPRGERATIAGTLGIVGVHFLVMLPTFGVLVGLLGAACTLNAIPVWRTASYPVALAWAIDGMLKLAFGAAMLSTSPMLR